MDYPFFVAPLLEINQQTLDNLKSELFNLKFDPFPSLKELDHSDYHPHPDKFKQACYKLHKELDLFEDSDIIRFTITKLKAGTSAAEHSDYYVLKGAAKNLENIQTQHKIHVPLITNKDCLSLHRRTKELDFKSFHMPLGSAYAYNDVAWHKIVNNSLDDRYHLIIFYKDKDLTKKRKILDMLKIDYNNFYEDINYEYPF